MSADPVSVQTIPAAVATKSRPNFKRTLSGSLSERRPHMRLTLTSTEQADFSAAIASARSHLVSDAAKLPKSTNMGLGNQAVPQSVVKHTNNYTANVAPKANPWPIAQPVADHERAFIPSEHETRKARASQSHGWEESDTFELRASHSPDSPQTNAIFLRAIPCMYVADVRNATTFYKDILGFSLLGKPDLSHASLVRSPPAPKGAPKQGGSLTHAPADSVQVYLRVAPMGSDGQRSKPPPTTLWIMVNDVDKVHAELQAKWTQFQPRVDEYFPMHSFGDAKILAKPQNKAWGNREMHVVDGDENKIIFFRELQ